MTQTDADPPIRLRVEGVSLAFGDRQALRDVTFSLAMGECLAFIGPSGCGTSSMLKCINRMHDATPTARMTGRILLDGHDINAADIDPPLLRRRLGWVAQHPDPFAWSVFDNVAYGPRLHGLVEDGAPMAAHVRDCLIRAHLWDEVGDRLDCPGVELSLGQQQRLCIARALGTFPDILLMDEPCGSLDPIATRAIEGLLMTLKGQTAMIVITHNFGQARRIADRVAFFHTGTLREIGPTERVFTAPRDPLCAAFLRGVFG